MRILSRSVYLITIVTSLGFAACRAEATGTSKPPQNSYEGPPMRFSVVRSEASECEPNCPQWISAEGVVTPQTPELFKKILKQAGKTRLPILISSAGGDVDAAMAMGEIIRTKKLDVGVGWTLFSGCWPSEKFCLIHKQQNGLHRGTPVTWRAYCVAACAFILAGGRRRLAGGASLGTTELSRRVSSQKVFYEERYRLVNGKKKLISRKIVKRGPVKSYTTSKLDKSIRKKLSTYAGRMGLTKDFLAFFSKAQSGSVYFLTSTEALSAGLVTGLDSARSLADKEVCLTAPVAENCVKLAASDQQ